MSQSRHVAIAGGAATALAATALAGVFLAQGWWLRTALGVAAVVAAMIGARALRSPLWVQPVAGLGALLVYLTATFGQGHGFLGVIPTPGSLAALRGQIGSGFRDIATMAAPVPVRPGLLLLSVIGVSLIAIVVDVIAVGLRRPALAGLPLLALYTVPVTIDRTSLPLWAFAAGAAGYLALLSTEHIQYVQGWGLPFRARSAWGTRRAAATAATAGANVAGPMRTTGSVLGLAGVVVALAVPVALPVSTEGWFGLVGTGDVGAGSGRTIQTINPITQLRGQLRQGSTVELLRVRTTDESPFYLRLTTLDQFTGSGWTQRGLSAKPSDRVSENDPRSDRIRGDAPTRRQQTRIQVRGLTESPYLPIYANPRNVDVAGDWRWDKRSQSVFSTRNRTGGLTYSFDSLRILYTPELLADAPPVAGDDTLIAHYTGLGQRGSTAAQAKAIADGIIQGKATQFDKVAAINEFFSPRNGFVYSEETAPGTSDSDLLAFLKNKRGYCEQYASAMAYLVRAAGIPARVAVGFGYGATKNGYRSITNRDAHAWVEVYFSGLGWVPFDPTPPGGTGRTGNLSWTASLPTAGPVTGPDGGGQPTQPGQPGSASPGPLPAEKDVDTGAVAGGANGGPPRPLWQRILFPWTLGALALLGVLALPAGARWRAHRRRLAVAGGADPVAAAHAAWDEVEDTLVDLRAAAPESETPRALARRLADTGCTADAALTLLAHAEERARYAPRTAALPGLADAVEEVRAALHRQAGRRVRLLARLMPASVLAAAAASGRRGNDRVSLALADARVAVSRRLGLLRRLRADA